MQQNIVNKEVQNVRFLSYCHIFRKATRATLILIPLLGLQYLLFPVRPESGSPLEHVYHIAIALLVSLQVFITASCIYLSVLFIQIVIM